MDKHIDIITTCNRMWLNHNSTETNSHEANIYIMQGSKYDKNRSYSLFADSRYGYVTCRNKALSVGYVKKITHHKRFIISHYYIILSIRKGRKMKRFYMHVTTVLCLNKIE